MTKKTMPTSIIEKAKKIKLVIFDVDGVLTDGRLYFFDNELECKEFHVHDGIGIINLQNNGIDVAVITQSQSPLIDKRMKHLKIKHYYQGQKEKRVAYQELRNQLSLEHDQIAYVGDDLVDLPVMLQVGLSIAVANALPYVAERATWQTRLSGGQGAAREVSDMILTAQGLFSAILEQHQP